MMTPFCRKAVIIRHWHFSTAVFQCCKIGPKEELGVREGEGKEKEGIQWYWKKGRDKLVFKVISSLDKWLKMGKYYIQIHTHTRVHRGA